MQEAFGVVIFVVVGVAAVVAIVSLLGRAKLYDQIGRGGLRDEREAPPREPEGAAASAGVRDAEIRQMIEAGNARRRRRGQDVLDVESELQRLTAAPEIDAGLRGEIRDLVVARNARRARAGQPPLNIEEEIERQVRQLGGS